MRRLLHCLIVCMLFVALACNKVPSDIIQPEEMAYLMADIRTADGVVTLNRGDYIDFESKKALREAVLERHNVTQAQFDSSIVWYGRNIAEYQKISDRTMEILQKRLVEVNKQVSQMAVSIAGDSADVWNAPAIYAFTKSSPSNYITFSYDSDTNWEKGDFYTWRVKFVVEPNRAQWSMTILYDDGVIETLTNPMSTNATTTQEMTVFTDSTRTATHISGWMKIDPLENKPAVLDSVGLIRFRKDNPNRPNHRRVGRRIFPPKE